MSEKQRHPTLERLFEAANVSGPAALAKAMNESEQAVTNWGTRGVSKDAALKAEGMFGRFAVWILTGNEPQQHPSATSQEFKPNQPLALMQQAPVAIDNVANIEQAMKVLADHLEQMDDYARDNASDVLRRLAAKPEEHARAASLFTAAFHSRRKRAA